MMARWTVARKHDIVTEIKAGTRDRAETMEEYNISEDEMAEWERDAEVGLQAHKRCNHTAPYGSYQTKRRAALKAKPDNA